MRIFLDIQDGSFFSRNKENAISKPRFDTQRTLVSLGYVPVIARGDFSLEGLFPKGLKQRVQKKLNRWQFTFSRTRAFYRASHLLNEAAAVKTESCSSFLKMLQQLFENAATGLSEDAAIGPFEKSVVLSNVASNEIFVQYPFLSLQMLSLLKQLREKRCFRLTVLFHDFYTLREHRENDVTEHELLTIADRIIVHSQPMADVLLSMGYKGEVYLLNYFDYLLDERIVPLSNVSSITTSTPTLCFAGNLDKSVFLSSLEEFDLPIHLYGRKPQTYNLLTKPFLLYEGSFNADSPCHLQGDWGLVWDGESADTCSGQMGEYLAYNSPFKFSLYLSVGKPVIVWSRSAMALYVREEHLGICVDSLQDISRVISSLTSADIQLICQSVNKVAQWVRKGKMLERALQ